LIYHDRDLPPTNAYGIDSVAVSLWDKQACLLCQCF